MSPDDLKKFTVKIYLNGKNGTGVLIKPNRNSRYSYILTAKHNFFTDNEIKTESYFVTYRHIPHSNKNYISRKVIDDKNITILNEKVFFLENSNVDIAILVVSNKDNSHIDSVPTLKIQETSEYEDEYELEFCIMGYPISSEDYRNPIKPYMVKYHQNNTKKGDEHLKEFRSNDGGLSFEEMQGQVAGISGGGVFHLGKDSVELHSIEHRCKEHNIFISSRLDFFIDDINKRIVTISEEFGVELDTIECGSKILSGGDDDYINIGLYFDNHRSEINEQAEKALKNLSDKKSSSLNFESSSFLDISRKVRNRKRKIDKEIKELSRIFVKLALLSSGNKKRHATTRYFNQAIKFNSEYKSLLILEKDSREKNTQNTLNNENPFESLEAKKERLWSICNDENAVNEDRKSAVIKIIKYFDDDNTKDNQEYIKIEKGNLVSCLESIIDCDSTLIDQYKYLHLGDLLYNFSKFREYSFYFYMIYSNVVDNFPDSYENNNLLKSVNRRIERMKEEAVICFNEKDIEQKYQAVLDAKSEYFKTDTKKMIYDLHNDNAYLRSKKIQADDNCIDILTDVKDMISDQAKYNQTIPRLQSQLSDLGSSLDNVEFNLDGSISDVKDHQLKAKETINKIDSAIEERIHKLDELDSLFKNIQEYFDEYLGRLAEKNQSTEEELSNYAYIDLKNSIEENNKISAGIKESLHLFSQKLESDAGINVSNSNISKLITGNATKISDLINQKHAQLCELIKHSVLDKKKVEVLGEINEKSTTDSNLDLMKLLGEINISLQEIRNRPNLSKVDINTLAQNINDSSTHLESLISTRYTNIEKNIDTKYSSLRKQFNHNSSVLHKAIKDKNFDKYANAFIQFIYFLLTAILVAIAFTLTDSSPLEDIIRLLEKL